MAVLWLHEVGGWVAAPLAPGRYALSPAATPPARRLGPAAALNRGELLLRGVALPAGNERWTLMSPTTATRVNGSPVWLGVRVLADRDEVRLPGGTRLYFSTERLAAVTPLPAGGRVIHCVRCLLPIDPGCAAVQCPACLGWHHQNGERDCWTYTTVCASCPQSTAANAGFSWAPAPE